MLESNFNKQEGSVNVKRRAFVVSFASAIGGLALWSMRKPRLAEATAAKEAPPQVTIVD
jgi:hypothetical protein